MGCGLRVAGCQAEKELLAEYMAVCGLESLATYGGAWRLRMRAQPDLVRRILAEVRSMAGRGLIRTDAGGPVLVASPEEWEQFKSDVHAGRIV